MQRHEKRKDGVGNAVCLSRKYCVLLSDCCLSLRIVGLTMAPPWKMFKKSLPALRGCRREDNTQGGTKSVEYFKLGREMGKCGVEGIVVEGFAAANMYNTYYSVRDSQKDSCAFSTTIKGHSLGGILLEVSSKLSN